MLHLDLFDPGDFCQVRLLGQPGVLVERLEDLLVLICDLMRFVLQELFFCCFVENVHIVLVNKITEQQVGELVQPDLVDLVLVLIRHRVLEFLYQLPVVDINSHLLGVFLDRLQLLKY